MKLAMIIAAIVTPFWILALGLCKAAAAGNHIVPIGHLPHGVGGDRGTGRDASPDAQALRFPVPHYLNPN